jgi:hypothetical protein
MSDTSTTPTTTTTPATTKPRVNEIQDKAMTNAVATYKRILMGLLGAPDALLLLASAGYNESKLNSGIALAIAVDDEFSQRQTAIAAYNEAFASCKASRAQATNSFKSYRSITQANFKGPVRATLGASGRFPTDQDKFRTMAATAYSTALASPQLSQLAENGWTRERLTESAAQIGALTTEEGKLAKAEADAIAATEKRDAAFNGLQAWMGKLRAIAKDSFKTHPEQLKLLVE